jgi:hypothetical protein
VTLSSIHIYGAPNDVALGRLFEKARLLGRGAVVVESLFAGFTRFVFSAESDAPFTLRN